VQSLSSHFEEVVVIEEGLQLLEDKHTLEEEQESPFRHWQRPLYDTTPPNLQQLHLGGLDVVVVMLHFCPCVQSRWLQPHGDSPKC
jgi:hypothetical protein